jgi:sugar lactone lactonase YvrE
MLPSRIACVFSASNQRCAAFKFPLVEIPRLSAARRLFAAALFLCLGPAVVIHAQTAIFMGELQQIGAFQGGGYGTAVDSKGNVWSANSSSDGVIELQAVNGIVPPNSAGVSVASGAFTAPRGVAVDAAGDVFVADAGGNKVYEIVAVSGSIPASPTIQAIGSGFTTPWGLAFDSHGNLWVADRGNNAIKELVAVSGSIPVSPTINTVGSGFSEPEGAAIDASGDVFVADANNSEIKEMIAVSGSIPASPTINVLGSGFSFPAGVAVDSKGDVFVSDSLNSAFKEMVAVGGSIPAVNPTILTLDPAFAGTSPSFSVTTDAYNNVFFSQSTAGGAVNVFELGQAGIFGQVNTGVGGLSTPVNIETRTLTFVFGFLNPGAIQAPTVYTQGASGQDFADTGAGTCDTNGFGYNYTVSTNADTCSVTVSFTPLYPGTRLGAVQLYEDEEGLIASGPLTGVGVAPMINFGIENGATYTPSFTNQAAISFGFQNPENIAVDTKHNIYIADRNGNTIYKATAASSYQTLTTAVTANYPLALALDGAGNLIWTDYGSAQILEAQAVNGALPASPTVIPLGTGVTWSGPGALALDGQGNAFIGDANGIREIVAVNGQLSGSSKVRLIESSINPSTLAFDSSGDLFLTPGGSNVCLDEIAAVNGQIPSSPTIQTVYCTLDLPLGLAVDAAGNVWESDFYGGQGVGVGSINKILAVNGVIPASPTVIAFSGGDGFGLGLDENGNVFASEYPYVYQLDFSDPPSFTWSGSTDVGQTSPTTYTAFAEDAGNMPLTLGVPTSGTNPAINVNWSWQTGATNACPSVASGAGSASNIAVSAMCALPINFAPQTSGPLSGQLTFFDDNLYVASNYSYVSESDATQSISLNGTAIGGSMPTINWTVTTPINYGTSLSSADFNASAIFDGETNISGDGTFAYYVGSVGGTAATLSTVLPGGTQTLCVQWTPSSEFTSQYTAASLCENIVVNADPTSVSYSPASPIINPAALGAAQFNASAYAGETNISADGTFIYYVGPVGGTVATTSTVLPVGNNQQLCVQWTPNSTYATDYNSSSACALVSDISTQPTTTALSANANPVFIGTLVTFTATVTPTIGTITPTGNVTFFYGSNFLGIGTLSGGTAKFSTTSLPLGSNSITAVYPGDTNNLPSTSAPLVEQVEDFTLVANPPTTANIEPGASTSFSFTLSPLAPATTLPATITLSVGGLPGGATYTLTPSTIAAGQGSTNLVLNVTAPITNLAAFNRPGTLYRGNQKTDLARAVKSKLGLYPYLPFASFALLLLPMAGRLRRAGKRMRRTFFVLLLLVASLAGSAAISGCGNLASGYFGQLPVTFSVTVTANSGSLNHSSAVSLTVE